ADSGEAVLVVHNQSDVDWSSTGTDRVELSLRWRSTDGAIEFLDERFRLPSDLAAGAEVEVTVVSSVARSVASGTYELIVDVVRDREAFFGETTGGAHVSTVRLDDASGSAIGRPTRLPVPEMARSDLWRAAVGLAVAHPMLGVGTGNFRLLYGPELGLSRFPRSSHAHSLYLEPAASSGVPAALALIAALGVAVRGAFRGGGRTSDSGRAAFVAALAVMAVHGLVDWPLVFTASGTLFFVLLLVVAGLGRPGERAAA
ncbi:MAG: O-antigen ligase family protein, partial [Actinomycetota bacterium]|nr:O-antigen ligase family protein [Actinomycetota bacterium]